MQTCLSPRDVPGFGSVRCGRCPSCLELRAFLKRSRIALEQADHAGEKAWFCTLTFADHKSGLAEKDSYRDVQLWLKRVRKGLAQAGVLEKGLRYIGVAEYGNATQRLHYHVLLWAPVPITQRQLASWHKGHFQYRVADESRWHYLVKYLQKQGARIRGSTRLGSDYVRKVAEDEQVSKVLAVFPNSRITRIGNHMVPRDIGRDYSHMGPPRLVEVEWPPEAHMSASNLRASSTRVSVSGISDDTWEKLMEHQRKANRTLIGQIRRPNKHHSKNDELSGDVEYDVEIGGMESPDTE